MSPLLPPDPSGSSPFALLPPPERQVLEAALDGAQNKVIARRLGVSVRTVERYRASAFQRLGVDTLVQVAALRTAPTAPAGGTFDARFAVAAPAGLVDREGRFVAVNAGLCNAYGFAENELLGLTYPALVHPADRPAVIDPMSRIFAGESDSHRVAKRMLKSDGTVSPSLLALSAVWSDSGEPAFVLGQLLNIDSAGSPN